MKVLDLQCDLLHRFEGWFASEDDYVHQLSGGLLTCPLCGSAQVHKTLSAPRLNLKAGRKPEAASASSPVEGGGALAGKATGRDPKASPPDQSTPHQPTPSGGTQALALPVELQARWLQAMRAIVAQSEDVGERFVDEVRAMHYGEIQERAVRGQATPEQAMELLDEGIGVLPLPDVGGIKDTLQ